MSLKLFLFSLLLLLTTSFNALAQRDTTADKPKFKLRDRIFVGGGLQLSFGNTTVMGASPIVGYRITDKASAGVGVTYVYFRQKFPGYPVYQTSIYGGNVFGRYTIWKNLFAHAELGFTNWEAPEILNNHYTGRSIRINSFSMPLGGGYAQPIGRNSYFEIMALYDVLYYRQAFQPSGSPFTFRAGVNIGF
jgi:hypothetical protein